MAAPTRASLWSRYAPAAFAGALLLTMHLSRPHGPSFVRAGLFPTESEVPLAHPWQLQQGKYWQIRSDTVESVEATDAAEQTNGVCRAGMVEVEGPMKGDRSGDLDALDYLQSAACTDWITRTFPERCAHYDRSRWLSLSRNLATEHLHFCIDRFEYPNERGAFPWIVVNWAEAKRLCEAEGKRLCNEVEWTFACEGSEATPYPYGYDRDPEACVVDRPWLRVDEAALAGRTNARALAEIDRLWQGEPSGSRPRCRSPFGVYDMTGNIDEWTASARIGERPSILKGGYWGPVRGRCRPSTRAHAEDFAFYQQGLRCCADVPQSSATAAPSAPSNSAAVQPSGAMTPSAPTNAPE